MKQYLKNISFLAAILAITFSCKKELDEIPTTKPVFTFNGTLGTTELNLNAGDGDTLMSTSKWEWHGVPVITGIIGNDQNYVQLDLYSGDVDLPTMNSSYQTLTHLNGAFFPTGNFTSLYKTQLGNSSSISKIIWEMGDLNFSNDLHIADPGIYDIGAKTTFSNGLQIEVSNDVIVGYVSHQLFQLHTAVANQMLTAQIITESDVSSIDWIFGGQTHTTTTKIINEQISGVSGGSKITATVHFSNGTSRTRTLSYDTTGQGNYTPDYVYQIESQSQANNIDYKAKISVHLNGNTYTTAMVEGQENIINITKKEQYTDKITGKDAIKLTGSINGKFKNTSTSEIIEGKFEFVMAFQIEN